MTRSYTVIYTLTRRDATLCFHHFARVTAADPLAAVELCRRDALPGFTYATLIVLEGHLTAIEVGKDLLCHTFDEGRDR